MSIKEFHRESYFHYQHFNASGVKRNSIICHDIPNEKIQSLFSSITSISYFAQRCSTAGEKVEKTIQCFLYSTDRIPLQFSVFKVLSDENFEMTLQLSEQHHRLSDTVGEKLDNTYLYFI